MHIDNRGPLLSGVIAGCTFTNISILHALLHAVYLPTPPGKNQVRATFPLLGSVLSFDGYSNYYGWTHILVSRCHVSHVTVSAVPPIAPSNDTVWNVVGGVFFMGQVETTMVSCTISSIAMVAASNEAGPVGLKCKGGLVFCFCSAFDIIDSTISGVTLLARDTADASCYGLVFHTHVQSAMPTHRGFELKNSRVENISYTSTHPALSTNQDSQRFRFMGGVLYEEDQFLHQGDSGELFPNSGARLVGAAIDRVTITLDGTLGSPRNGPFYLTGGVFCVWSSTLELIDTSVTSISLSAPGEGSYCEGGVLTHLGIILTSHYQLVQRQPDVAFLRCVISDVHSFFKEVKGGVIYLKVGVSCPYGVYNQFLQMLVHPCTPSTRRCLAPRRSLIRRWK